MREQFKAWRRPNKAEIKELWNNAIFTFDTNTLLNVYRYSEETSNVLFELLEKLKAQHQLWLTHQAALEFHKNRHIVIAQQEDKFDHVRKALENVKNVLQEDKRDKTESALETLINPEIDKLLDCISEMKMQSPNLISKDIYLDRLYRIFEGTVGEPFDAEELESRKKQAIARLDNSMPPGFKDYNGKMPEKDRKLGDTLIWLQILEYAKTKKKNIILVTDDQKEDWWLKDTHQKIIGPLPQLRQEMIDYAQVEFYMYNSEAFIKHAGDHFKMNDESIERSAEEAREIVEKSSREYETSYTVREVKQALEDLRSSPMLRAAELGQWLQSTQLSDDQMPTIRKIIEAQKVLDDNYKRIGGGGIVAEYLQRASRDQPWNQRASGDHPWNQRVGLHDSIDTEAAENNE